MEEDQGGGIACLDETPAILVPGIKRTLPASIMKKDSNFASFPYRHSGSEDSVDQNPDAWFSDVDSVTHPTTKDPIYGRLFDMLRAELKSPVHIFHYDTRRSCIENGKELRHFVEDLKEKLSADRFDFITHSIGGMVFSCFLKELGGGFDNIGRVVITACPFLGSVCALTSLLGGRKAASISSPDFCKDARQPTHTYPATYELLPVYPKALSFSPHGEMFDIFNPTHWQSDIASLPIFKERLMDARSFRDPSDPAMLPLDSLPAELKERFLIIAGEGEPTAAQGLVHPFSPDKRTRNFLHFSQQTGRGDGTVLLDSSAIYRDSILTITVRAQRRDRARHVFMLNEKRALSLISRFLRRDAMEPNWWSTLGSKVRKL